MQAGPQTIRHHTMPMPQQLPHDGRLYRIFEPVANACQSGLNKRAAPIFRLRSDSCCRKNKRHWLTLAVKTFVSVCCCNAGRVPKPSYLMMARAYVPYCSNSA